jgi:ABC-type glycerol-3-phosphate transport system substrate-binding protein
VSTAQPLHTKLQGLARKLPTLFLQSILQNGAYEPLNGYEGLVANFEHMYDTMEQIMTYSGNIFAVPFDISPMMNNEITNNFVLYGYEMPHDRWTFDDLWALCDEIIARGDSLSVYPAWYTPEGEVYYSYHLLLTDYVQRSIDKESLDKSELKDFLTKIKKYTDAGVLYGENYLLGNTYHSNYFFIKFLKTMSKDSILV